MERRGWSGRIRSLGGIRIIWERIEGGRLLGSWTVVVQRRAGGGLVRRYLDRSLSFSMAFCNLIRIETTGLGVEIKKGFEIHVLL